MSLFSTIKETIALFSGGSSTSIKNSKASSSSASLDSKDNSNNHNNKKYYSSTTPGIGNHRYGGAGITPTPIRRPRGRPRKRRPLGEDPQSHHGLFSGAGASRHYVPLKDEDASRRDQEEEKKPREEMSYREIYPDLEVLLPLRITGVEMLSSAAAAGVTGAKSSGLDASVDDLSYSGNPKVWSAAPPPDPKTVPLASFRSINDSTAAAASIAASPVERMFDDRIDDGGVDFGASHLAITRPAKQFLKHVPLSNEDLEATVEYDMDDQDYYWLDEVNNTRRKGRQKLISRKNFEFIMDRFEKEWFQLTKPLRNFQAEHEDSHADKPCEICGSQETSNSNAIVYCDGCNVAVHQECYGVPHIPEGSWLCRKCMLAPGKNIGCLFCPRTDGAFKQTVDNRWAHLFCAHWIDEVCVSNEVYQEPIDHIADIPKARWKLACHLCRRKGGAPIQCSARFCRMAYHPTCGKAANLFMDFNERVSYCPKHTPLDHVKKLGYLGSRLMLNESDADDNLGGSMSKNSSFSDLKLLKKQSRKSWGGASNLRDEGDDQDYGDGSDGNEDRGGRKSASFIYKPVSGVSSYYTAGYVDPDTFKSVWEDAGVIASQKNGKSNSHVNCPSTSLIFVKSSGGVLPILPIYIVNKVADQVVETKGFAKGDYDDVHDFIIKVSKYWALKRESKRGIHLLTRLLLEPWSQHLQLASPVADQELLDKMNEKHFRLKQLKKNLEKVRLLTDLVRKREREKLQQCQMQSHILSFVAKPVNHILRQIWIRLSGLDTRGIFEAAVPPEEAPDYYQIIKHPMDMAKMLEKINNCEYSHVTDMFDDCELMLSNAQIYNRKETVYYKAAGKIRDSMRHLWEFTIENEEALTSLDDVYEAESDGRGHSIVDFLKSQVFNYHDSGIKKRMSDAGLFPLKQRIELKDGLKDGEADDGGGGKGDDAVRKKMATRNTTHPHPHHSQQQQSAPSSPLKAIPDRSANLKRKPAATPNASKRVRTVSAQSGRTPSSGGRKGRSVAPAQRTSSRSAAAAARTPTLRKSK